jgi:hypothetical protein
LQGDCGLAQNFRHTGRDFVGQFARHRKIDSGQSAGALLIAQALRQGVGRKVSLKAEAVVCGVVGHPCLLSVLRWRYWQRILESLFATSAHFFVGFLRLVAAQTHTPLLGQ